MALSHDQRKSVYEKDQRRRYAEANRAGGRKAVDRLLYGASGYDQDAYGDPIMTFEDWQAAGRPDLLDYSPLEAELVAKLNGAAATG